MSARERGVSARAAVVTCTAKRTGPPAGRRIVTVPLASAGTVSRASPSNASQRWLLPSKLTCSTRTIQDVSLRCNVTCGDSRALRAAIVFTPSNDRWRARSRAPSRARWSISWDSSACGKGGASSGRESRRAYCRSRSTRMEQQKEPERDGGRAFQTIGDRPGTIRRGDDRPGRAPGEVGRRATRVARGEAHTLVRRVGPQVHDTPGTAIQVDLEGVAARVLIDARLVA